MFFRIRKPKYKTGLVMEGGAMRGMFTAGVIDVLLENDIKFDGAVGVSAGATFGCNYKSNQPGRVIRCNLRFCRDSRFCSIRSLIKTGDLFGADFCYREIPDELDKFDKETFNNSDMEFHVVCTDVDTGKPLYKKFDNADDEFLDYLRASASMPLVSKIVTAGGKSLLDGGLTDPIPIKYFERIGYNRNVVILTQPESYVKKPPTGMVLMKKMLSKYPEVVRAMETRHIGYNETVKYIKEKESRGEIFVIRPQAPLNISRVERDPSKLGKVYDSGRQVAMLELERLKEYLNK